MDLVESDVTPVRRLTKWSHIGPALCLGSIEPVGRLDRQAFLECIPTFEKDFGGPFTLEYSLHDWHTSVRNGVAWTSLVNDGVLAVKGRAPRHMRWNESGVLVRQPDGTWLIDRYHSTFLGFQHPDSAGS